MNKMMMKQLIFWPSGRVGEWETDGTGREEAKEQEQKQEQESLKALKALYNATFHSSRPFPAFQASVILPPTKGPNKRPSSLVSKKGVKGVCFSFFV